VSSPIWGSWPDIYYCLTVTFLSMWGALFDERTGLSFIRVIVCRNSQLTWDPCYIASGWTQQKTQFPRNLSIVACIFFVAETCLPSRRLKRDVCWFVYFIATIVLLILFYCDQFYLLKFVYMKSFPHIVLFSLCIIFKSRSQWPSGLRHELSSLARTLGSWVRILLKGMDVCVCVYSVFVLSHV
jgi:hypothetical protein